MCIQITILDHAGNAIINLDEAIKNLSYEENDNIGDMTGQVALIHPKGDADWDNIVNDLSAKNDRRILVRMSSAGRPNASKPRKLKGREIVLLELVPSFRKMGTDDWESILKGLSKDDTVKNLLKRDYSDGLLKYFYLMKNIYSSALIILCQGYLAVRAASGEAYDEASAEALNKMGWNSIEMGNHIKVLKEKVKEVSRAEWWGCLGEDADVAIKNEWIATKGSIDMPAEITELLQKLKRKDEISSEVVANAYNKLASCLGS